MGCKCKNIYQDKVLILIIFEFKCKLAFMKSYLIRLMLLIVSLIVLGIILFIWGSSSSLKKDENDRISTNNLPQEFKTDSTFSVLTYNIGHLSGLYQDKSEKDKDFYTNSFKKISTQLKAINADILSFQDIDFDSKRSYNTNQAAAFANLGYNFVAEAVNWDKQHVLSPYWPLSKQTGKVLSGLAVLSKYKIVNQERLLLPNNLNLAFHKKAFIQNRIAQVVQIDLNGTTITVINVHLEDRSKSSRAPQFSYVVDLFKEHAKKTPTILLGDFNSSIKKEDALIHELLTNSTIGHATYKNLDYIFFTKRSIEMSNSRIVSECEGLANHLPVLLEFKLK